MHQNSYTNISAELYEILEQDDEFRHKYIDFLGLLRDHVAPSADRFIEVVYSPKEIEAKLTEISDYLKQSEVASAIAFSNLNLATNLLKLASAEGTANFLAGVHADFDAIRRIRSRMSAFEPNAWK